MDYGFTPNDFQNRPPKNNNKKNLLLIVNIIVLCFCLIITAVCAVLLIEQSFYKTGNSDKVSLSEKYVEKTGEQDVEINVSVNNVSTKTYSTVADMIENVEKSIVAIGQTVDSVSGSGVVISDSGYIVTNNHVVEGQTSVVVTFIDGEYVTGEVYATDENTDLAIVYVKTDKTLYPATFGSSESLRKGDSVYAIGNPAGEYTWSATSGIVSYNNRPFTIDGLIMTLIQIDASVNPGNSGGGLFNSDGELVGIVNAKIVSTNVEGIGFAIPSSTVKAISEDLIKQKYVSGRPYLGISYYAKKYQTSFFGSYTYKFFIDSSAYCDELKEGDEIVSIGGMSLLSYSTQQILNGYAVGDTIEVVVNRNNQTITVKVVLQEYKGD